MIYALKKIKPEYKEAINKNNTEYFKNMNLSFEEINDIFFNSTSLGKYKVMNYFLENIGIEQFKTGLQYSLKNLIGSKGKLKALKTLENNGYVFHETAPILMTDAALHNNAEYTEFLCTKIDNEDKYLYLTLINILQKTFLKNNKLTLENIRDTIRPILQKCSPEIIEKTTKNLIEKKEPHETIAFLRFEYLEATLNQQQKIIKKNKI